MDDGQEAIKTAFANSDDKWASAEYRQSAASILLARALQKLERAGRDQEEK
jgi:CO/xanthine dehydrogenase FAD-binding subunit